MCARAGLFAVLLAACGGGGPAGLDPAPQPPGRAGDAPINFGALAGRKSRPRTPIADGYRDAAARIIAAARADDGAWTKLSYLTDRIGNRISGSPALERAIEWAGKVLAADGQESVHTEKVMGSHWVRGAESAELVAPVERPMAMLQLGGSGATPRGGLTADVIVVKSLEELDALGPKVKGKIVLFHHVMPAYDEAKGTGYEEARTFRSDGPKRAAKLGAAAALVRSVTARSLRSPHTGGTSFDDVKPIPAAALSTEDADLIARLAAAGEKVVVRVKTGGRTLPPARTANVIAELRGREKPDEIVLLGGHIDSWDVGQGAHDDGAGCAITMQALAILRKLALTPRRTIRVVLFTDEENGLSGAIAYAAAHAAEIPRHVMALEADTGAFAPRGFEAAADPAGAARLADIVTLLEPIGAARTRPGSAGADADELVDRGVLGLGLWMDESTYFDYHHTEADTLDKVRPDDLRLDVAAVAVMAYVIADLPDRIGIAPPPKKVP